VHRQSGRHLKTEYFIEVECLPDNQLFSPSEIVKRKYDKQSQPKYYWRMFHAIYQYGTRNGLILTPDNGKRLPGGKWVMTQTGKAQLKQGERSAKWLGKTWKSKFYQEDREAFMHHARTRLVETLGLCLTQKRQHEAAKRLEEAIMRKPSRKMRMNMGLWVAALIAAIVLTAGSLYNYNFLNEGYAVLRSEGPQAAFEFFQNRGETYDNIFGQAWAAYRNGDYSEAKSLCERVLKSESLKDQSRAYYLLGIIRTTEGEFDQAQEDLLTTIAIYETTGQERSKAKAQLALAKLYLVQKDIGNASYYANLAESSYDAWKDHFFLYIKSQIAFLKSDFDNALRLAEQREILAKDDNSQLGGIYADIGFYSCLIGNYERCFDFSMKAQSIAQKMDSEKLIMYNQVNFYLYMKCTFRDVSIYRETALNYARKAHDIRLMEYLYFVEKFTCPIPRPDPGDPDPPDYPDERENLPPQSPENRINGTYFIENYHPLKNTPAKQIKEDHKDPTNNSKSPKQDNKKNPQNFPRKSKN